MPGMSFSSRSSSSVILPLPVPGASRCLNSFIARSFIASPLVYRPQCTAQLPDGGEFPTKQVVYNKVFFSINRSLLFWFFCASYSESVHCICICTASVPCFRTIPWSNAENGRTRTFSKSRMAGFWLVSAHCTSTEHDTMELETLTA